MRIDPRHNSRAPRDGSHTPAPSRATRRVFALNVHANYCCQHSGACCTAGWSIPVEPDRRRVLGTDLLLPESDGACRFYDRQARRCRVHRDHGEPLLPSSCFHFPRRALIDDRGTFVSLSHFCPTAARLLVEHDEPLRIVESPPGFPHERDYDGLDGRGAWPPLIKADLLFDLDGFAAWEGFAIGALSSHTVPLLEILRQLAAAAEHVRHWSPHEEPLAERIHAVTTRSWTPRELATAWERYEPITTLDAYASVRACVPEGLVPPEILPEDRIHWADRAGGAAILGHVAHRYVAAKMFGSWAAYEAFGLRTMVAELALADLVLRVEAVRALERAAVVADVRVEAVRAADWLLVHLVDRPALIAWLGGVERG